MAMSLSEQGHFVLDVHYEDQDGPVSYIVSVLNYNMGIGAVTNVRVTISEAQSLVSEEERHQSPTKLVADVMSRAHNSEAGLLQCSISEVIQQVGGKTKKTKILDGFISDAQIDYNGAKVAGTFTCCAKAGKLDSVPVVQHFSTSLNTMLQYHLAEIKGTKDYPEAANAGKLSALALIRDTETLALWTTNIIKNVSDSKDIFTLFDTCLSTVKKMSEIDMDANTASSLSDSMIDSGLLQEYVFSKCKLAEQIVQNFKADTVQESFVYNILKTAISSASGASALGILKATASSQDYMLDLVPRFAKDEFKMELAPNKSWRSSKEAIATIPASMILSMTFDEDAIMHLQDPDCLIVNFSGAVPELAAKLGHMGVNGVYARNKKINALIRKKYIDGSSLSKSENELLQTKIRTKIFTPPIWLLTVAKALANSKNDPHEFDIRDVMPSETEEEAKEKKEAIQRKENKNAIKNFIEVACDIAKALYTFIYGARNNIIIEIPPVFSFGAIQYDGKPVCFEDSLGELIKVELRSPGYEDGNIGTFVGRLIDINFYHANGGGGTGQSSYRLRLSNVRAVEDGEESVINPLYTVEKSDTGTFMLETIVNALQE